MVLELNKSCLPLVLRCIAPIWAEADNKPDGWYNMANSRQNLEPSEAFMRETTKSAWESISNIDTRMKHAE
jgi:hypothetical protein